MLQYGLHAMVRPVCNSTFVCNLDGVIQCKNLLILAQEGCRNTGTQDKN